MSEEGKWKLQFMGGAQMVALRNNVDKAERDSDSHLRETGDGMRSLRPSPHSAVVYRSANYGAWAKPGELLGWAQQ